jgi:hypothetical protein
MKNKWDINKIEGKATAFGTGLHIIIPRSWAGKTIVAMLKSKYKETQK